MARLLISILLLLVGCSLAVAQERIIDEATYYQDIKSAGEYRLKENYRVKRTTTTTTPGPPMTLEIEEIEATLYEFEDFKPHETPRPPTVF